MCRIHKTSNQAVSSAVINHKPGASTTTWPCLTVDCGQRWQHASHCRSAMLCPKLPLWHLELYSPSRAGPQFSEIFSWTVEEHLPVKTRAMPPSNPLSNNQTSCACTSGKRTWEKQAWDDNSDNHSKHFVEFFSKYTTNQFFCQHLTQHLLYTPNIAAF